MLGGDSTPNSSTEEVVERFRELAVTDSATSSASSDTLAQAAVKIRDAMNYIDIVKTKVAEDEPEVYDKFLSLMRDFHNQRIDTAGVIERIKQIFHGHPDLITGFDNFLPLGHSTSGSDPAAESIGDTENDEDSEGSGTASPGGAGSRAATPTQEDTHKGSPPLTKADGEPTTEYIERVKQQCDAETWEQFMAILSRQYDNPESFDEEEMIKDVEELFEDHPELIPGFRTFLADSEERQGQGPDQKR
ncbi:hypothetical protein D9756_008434 [Leucocoprinus leucothites]|uniref:Uncharacterized protein n=1 Tax=Leucocoprinus leucothites TaxID=201217 RepID=A0A8H5D049_9AGAR|nr:hypothetical protein D9756_008434 [Leucoagaricus leucothites]